MNDPKANNTEGKKKVSVEMLSDNANALFWKIYAHFNRQYMAWIFAAIAMVLFSQNYKIGINGSESLPHKLYILHKGEMVKKGDIVAFAWQGGGKYAWMSPFKKGDTMLKYVLGEPGDRVFMDADRQFYVNGVPHAKAKEFSKTGKELTPLAGANKEIVIGPNQYYVGTKHVDSLDSRYDMVGLIDRDIFIGKAYVIF